MMSWIHGGSNPSKRHSIWTNSLQCYPMGRSPRLVLLILCILVFIWMFVCRFLNLDTLVIYRPPSPKKHAPSTDAPQTPMTTINPKFHDLLKLIDWPEPRSPMKHFKFSTNPRKCDYRLLNPRDTYKVGETLEVELTARDHNGRVKEYGGDFFQAKLHSPALKAGVTGQVKDYGNGRYLATFLLPWTGLAQVHIRLIHSSEAVDILKKKRESEPEKVFFHGFFFMNGRSEVVECNHKMTKKDLCRYKDPVSGDTWECVKPKRLPCDSWVYHSMGGYRNVTNKMEDLLLSGSVTDQVVPGSVPPINVISDNNTPGPISTFHFWSFTWRKENLDESGTIRSGEGHMSAVTKFVWIRIHKTDVSFTADEKKGGRFTLGKLGRGSTR